MPLDNTGLTTDLEVVNSAVQSMGGGDRRSRNEAIRTGLSDIEGFKQQNPEAVNQALQPAQQAYQNQQQYAGLKDTYDKNVKSYNDLRSTYDQQKAAYTGAGNTYNSALSAYNTGMGNLSRNAQYNQYIKGLASVAGKGDGDIYNPGQPNAISVGTYRANTNAAKSAMDAPYINPYNAAKAAYTTAGANANKYYSNLNSLFTNTSNSVAPLNTAYQKTQPRFNQFNPNPMDRV